MQLAVDSPSVLCSSEELALLARLCDASPMLGLSESALDDSGWNAVFNGLLARGVLELRTPGGSVRDVPGAGASSDDAGEVGVSPRFAPVIGLVLLGSRATTVQASGLADVRLVTYVREGDIAVAVERRLDGLLRLTPVEGNSVVTRVLSIVVDHSTGAPSAGVEVEIPTGEYDAALQRLDEDGLESAVDAVPRAAPFLAAVQSAQRTVVVSDVILEPDGGLAGEVLSILDGGVHGSWLVEQDEVSVVARPLDDAAIVAAVEASVA